jgi:transcriptional regulator with XRE-family HTH domain
LGLSSKKAKAATEDISAALLALRSTLGETQEGMARKLGCTLGAYNKWERGERTPGGEWLLKILALCPDEQTQAGFGLKAGTLSSQRLSTSSSPLSEGQENLLRHYNDAVTGLNILYEAAQAGQSGAGHALRSLAERINKRAGDWRQMKYLKK